LQVSVNRGGIVSAVKVLRSTPPYTDLMMTAVQEWRFRPAERQGPVESAVLVAAVFRPPTMNTPTLGSPPADVASSPREVPFPTRILAPPYPPQAIDNRVVLVEVNVTANGAVTQAKAIGPSSGFDSAAEQAARGWMFRPAELAGAQVSTIAYILFGFRQPSTTGDQ